MYNIVDHNPTPWLHPLTGVSICQELDLDEEESEAKNELFSSSVETPSQLSNALMKALKVGGQEDKHHEQDSERKLQSLPLFTGH